MEDELLVTFKEDVTEQTARRYAGQAEAEEVQTLAAAEDNTMLIELDESQDVESAIKEFQDMPEVEAIQPNCLYTTDEEETGGGEENVTEPDQTEENPGESYNEEDPLLKDQWNLEYIHAQEAWDEID